MNDGATGLYYYNARYYDPALHRFIQADTIVPDPNDPQTLNRFSYVNNNPVRYTDPTGHEAESQCPTELTDCVPWTLEEWLEYGLILTRQGSCIPTCNWTNLAKQNVVNALNQIKAIHGVSLIETIFAHPDGGQKLIVSLNYTVGKQGGFADPTINTMYINTLIPSSFVVVHEIGHLIDYRAGRNRVMFSYGGMPDGTDDVPGTETGGYWTTKVPGWDQGTLGEDGYSWSLTNTRGAPSGYATTQPWEDFAETFTWSVMPTEFYDVPSKPRRDALKTTLDIATR